MTEEQFATFMNTLVTEFDVLGKKLERRGMLAAEWKRALMPIDASLVNEALRKWFWKTNAEPSLERFVQTVDEVVELPARKRKVEVPDHLRNISDPIAGVVAHLDKITPASDEWARFHIGMLIKAHEQVDEERKQRSRRAEIPFPWGFLRQEYQALADTSPHLKGDCLDAIAGLPPMGIESRKDTP